MRSRVVRLDTAGSSTVGVRVAGLGAVGQADKLTLDLADGLEAGNGSDVLLSVVNCENDTLDGAPVGGSDGEAANVDPRQHRRTRKQQQR